MGIYMYAYLVCLHENFKCICGWPVCVCVFIGSLFAGVNPFFVDGQQFNLILRK